MSAPERCYNGISSVTSDNPLGAYPLLDPTQWAVFLDDFLAYDLAQATTHYTFTQTNFTDSILGPTGVVVLTSAGADNDLGQLQLTSGSMQLTSGKKAIFEAKIKVDKGAAGTIGEQEMLIGLATVATGANLTAADGLTLAVDDFVGFWSPDGGTPVYSVVRKSDVESSDTGYTMVDATWYVLSWYFNGTTVSFYVDDVLVATASTFPTAVVSPILYLKGGEAKACVLSCDYIFTAIER